MYKIRLENTVTHRIYEQMAEDINGGGKLYFRFSIDTFELDNGEYVLSLFDEGDNLLSEEVLRIGDFKNDAIQYSKGENTYIELVVKTVVQNKKNVTIDKVQTTILPDTGNDAMGSVVVDAQPLYDRALNEGKELGIIEQKEKLTAITINENGVYENEDGYNEIVVSVPDLNGSYDEGYSEGYDSGRTDGYNEGVEEGLNNAGGIIAETARVLNVTENGVYASKYTQDGDIIINSNQQITGVYDDGTNFYDTAELFCSYVQLDVIPTEETRIELWYLPNMPHMGDGFHRVLHSKKEQISFVFGGGGVNNTALNLKFGNKSVDYIPTKSFGTEWLHIIVDRNGATVNDVEMPFDSQATFSKTEVDLCINGGSDMGVVGRLANGTYGMVKIDDTTYIPYEGGFLNTNTDVLQPIIQPNLGILEDGTPITKATYLNGAVFDTGLKITEDSTIELWINKYSRSESGYYLYSDLFSVRRDSSYWYVNTAKLYYADSYRNYIEHITISKAGGFVVECEGTRTMSLDSINFSSGEDTIKIRTDNANFAYGLLKINGNIIVPSEDGFTNITTNAPLRRCEEWGGTFEYKNAFNSFNRYNSNDITIPREDTLIRSVNVNVIPKINVVKEGLKFNTSTFTEIPEWADFEGITNMNSMFTNCDSLVNVRHIDTSSVTNMAYVFNGCDNIKQIATLDTSNVINMIQLCASCGQLTEFPPLNTIRVTNMSQMLSGCGSLKKVPALDARSVVRQSYGIFGSGNLNNLTDFGGLIGLKASMDGSYGFEKCPNLTYESCINILNGLYNFAANGITPASNEGKLKVHSNFLTTVGDEITIGTNKGWTITA